MIGEDMPVLNIVDDLLNFQHGSDDTSNKEIPEEMKLRCDCCGEVIQTNEKYWLITSVGRQLDPEEDIDFATAICLMCAPHGFQTSLEVNQDD